MTTHPLKEIALSARDTRAQPPEPQPYRLDAQLRSVVLACESQWQEKGIAVSAELAPLTVTADKAMLSQVWTNLVHNAVKFTPQRGRITVSLHEEPGHGVVRVVDNGIGIAPTTFPRFSIAFSRPTGRVRTRAAQGERARPLDRPEDRDAPQREHHGGEPGRRSGLGLHRAPAARGVRARGRPVADRPSPYAFPFELV